MRVLADSGTGIDCVIRALLCRGRPFILEPAVTRTWIQRVVHARELRRVVRERLCITCSRAHDRLTCHKSIPQSESLQRCWSSPAARLAQQGQCWYSRIFLHWHSKSGTFIVFHRSLPGKTDKQPHKQQTDIQSNRQTDKQTDRQTDRQTVEREGKRRGRE